MSDPTRRFAGNNLTCQNYQLKAGTQPYAMPLLGVWGQFPQYRAREGAVDPLEDRMARALPISATARRFLPRCAQHAAARMDLDSAPKMGRGISFHRSGVPTATTTAQE